MSKRLSKKRIRRFVSRRVTVGLLAVLLIALIGCSQPQIDPGDLLISLESRHELSLEVNAASGALTAVHIIEVNADTQNGSSYRWLINGRDPSSIGYEVLEGSENRLRVRIPESAKGDIEISHVLSAGNAENSESLTLNASPADYDPLTEPSDAILLPGSTTPRDVYLIFHNNRPQPVSSDIRVGPRASSSPAPVSRRQSPAARERGFAVGPAWPGLRNLGAPEHIWRFNRDVRENMPAYSRSRSRSITGPQSNPLPQIGDVDTFRVDGTVSGKDSIDATLRWQHTKSVTIDGATKDKTVNIWVGAEWENFATNNANDAVIGGDFAFDAVPNAYIQDHPEPPRESRRVFCMTTARWLRLAVDHNMPSQTLPEAYIPGFHKSVYCCTSLPIPA